MMKCPIEFYLSAFVLSGCLLWALIKDPTIACLKEERKHISCEASEFCKLSKDALKASHSFPCILSQRRMAACLIYVKASYTCLSMLHCNNRKFLSIVSVITDPTGISACHTYACTYMVR